MATQREVTLLADSTDDESLSLGGALRPVGLRDVKAAKKKPRPAKSDFLPLDDSTLPKIDGAAIGMGLSGGVRVISDRSKKNATTESEQFNSLLEQRLAKVKAATVDISKQLDDIEPHFTPDPVDDE